MTRPITPRRTGWNIFRWPLLIGLVSLVGLVSALVGDGSWAALGATIVLMTAAWRGWSAR